MGQVGVACKTVSQPLNKVSVSGSLNCAHLQKCVINEVRNKGKYLDQPSPPKGDQLLQACKCESNLTDLFLNILPACKQKHPSGYPVAFAILRVHSPLTRQKSPACGIQRGATLFHFRLNASYLFFRGGAFFAMNQDLIKTHYQREFARFMMRHLSEAIFFCVHELPTLRSQESAVQFAIATCPSPNSSAATLAASVCHIH